MRLHNLRLQAFGPFAGTHTIDFNALSADGLFLLHGDAGAGKSTVFAAICFALYGKPPGDRDLLLRSHHAPAGLLTEVTLEVTLAGRCLRIHRIPAQTRLKISGKGETPQKPETRLEEWAGDADGQGRWEPSSKSHQEATVEITGLLGMSREQFCQVVLLPQNEFTKFLHSDAHGRRDLLGKLFRTHRFSFIERWLNEHSRTTEKNRDEARGDVLRLIERIHQAAGPDLKAEHPAPSPDDPHTLIMHAHAWAKDLARVGQAEHENTLRVAAAAKENQIKQQSLERAARDLHQQQATHSHATQQLAVLQEQAPHQEILLHRRDQARRAQQVAPLLHAADTAANDHSQAQEAERAARECLKPEHVDLDAGQLQSVEQQARDEAAVLRALVPQEDTLRRLAEDLERIDIERQDFAAEQRAADAWLEAEPDRRRHLEARREAARQAESEGSSHQDARNALNVRLEAAERRDAHRAKIVHAEQDLANAEEATGQAYLAIRRRRTEGMAAELAATLTDGIPCPVCGSCAHPAPAAPQDGQPTRQDEQHAEVLHEQAKARQQTASTTLQQLREQAATATGEAGDTPLAELQTQQTSITTQLADALNRAADQGPAQEELHLLDRGHTDMSQQHSTATAGLSARNASYDTLTLSIEELTVTLEARGIHSTVAARADDLNRTAEPPQRSPGIRPPGHHHRPDPHPPHCPSRPRRQGQRLRHPHTGPASPAERRRPPRHRGRDQPMARGLRRPHGSPQRPHAATGRRTAPSRPRRRHQHTRSR
ncbi:AAA family ATPase [Streptomyces sp. NPDC058579]|uniref:AAA family ATPase n=1 Tax=Streptomyces sp. NPDC058579 TaxID=3346548 RepID=UPI003646004D